MRFGSVFLRPRRVASLVGLAALAVVVATTPSGAATKPGCNNSNPVLIGSVFSMTGPAAGIGRLNQYGASLAVRDVNRAGGILGRCVKQVLKDDQGSPTTAAQVIREAVDQDKVQFVTGPFLSSPTAVTLPVTTQAKIISMNQSAFLDSADPKLYPYTFPVEIHSDLQTQIFIPFLKAHKWTRVAILAPNNAFGTVFVPTFTDLAGQAGITVVKSALVNSGTPDVTPQMQELKGANPQALVWAVNADPDQIAAIKARNSLGWNVPVAAVSSIYNTATTNNFTPEQMQNIYGYAYKTFTYTAKNPRPSDPLAKKFISELATWIHAHNIKIAVSQAGGGYDAFMLLAQAANGAKSLDADKIKQYFETHPMRGTRGKYLWTSSQHRGLLLEDFTFVHAKSLNNFGLTKQVK